MSKSPIISMGKMKGMLNYLKVADIVVEVVDSRVPFTGRIPNLKEVSSKKRIIVFTKVDLSDFSNTERWKRFYENEGYNVVLTNLKKRTSVSKLKKLIQSMDIRKKLKETRMIVLGLPNVGKSSLINSIILRKKIRVGNEPGITKGIQWIKIDDDTYILDTPGIIQKRLNFNALEYKKLCLVGSIIPPDWFLEDLIDFLFDFLRKNYPNILKRKYEYYGSDYSEFIEHVAKMYNYIKEGGEHDRSRTLRKILNDSINGEMGNVSFDLIQTTSMRKDDTF